MVCVSSDLKLENLLLDSDGIVSSAPSRTILELLAHSLTRACLSACLPSFTGHVRLSDFGLSAILKDNNDRIHSFSGTATYLAPEILSDRGVGHGKSVDFWCFGVMLFIMLTQEVCDCLSIVLLHYSNLAAWPRACEQPPFWSENARELFHMIKNEELVWSNWDYLSPEAVSILKGVCRGDDVHASSLLPSVPNLVQRQPRLMTQLMTKDPTKRLGCGPEGWRGVREHAFFDGMDWAKLLAKKVKPPIRPKIKVGSLLLSTVGVRVAMLVLVNVAW